jgi:hypothetical protein
MASHLSAINQAKELEEIRRRDHDELVEMMTELLRDKTLLKLELASSTLEDAQDVVQAMEQARLSISCSRRPSASLRIGIESGGCGRDAGATVTRRFWGAARVGRKATAYG